MKDFNGRKWDKFDGKEVASLEYAKDAHLEDYYRRAPNLMERDQQFRPIVFSKGQEQDNIIPQRNIAALHASNLRVFYELHSEST
ncbi:MEI2-like protein [Medicago truncatula]|uniref:MEI2-like protein n=1 Tax=Medicago truncatula TaxID=3880 RepID=A0A072UGG5_MEDTR|nr:MEI2-like protein [Medicago truncatula]